MVETVPLIESGVNERSLIDDIGVFIAPANGRLVSNIPKAIGTSNKGSNPFAIAKYSNIQAIKIITICRQSILTIPIDWIKLFITSPMGKSPF